MKYEPHSPGVKRFHSARSTGPNSRHYLRHRGAPKRPADLDPAPPPVWTAPRDLAALPARHALPGGDATAGRYRQRCRYVTGALPARHRRAAATFAWRSGAAVPAPAASRVAGCCELAASYPAWVGGRRGVLQAGEPLAWPGLSVWRRAAVQCARCEWDAEVWSGLDPGTVAAVSVSVGGCVRC